MIVDTEVLRDEDVSALAASYARMVKDDSLEPRLRAFSWCMALALLEESARRSDTAGKLPPDPGLAGPE